MRQNQSLRQDQHLRKSFVFLGGMVRPEGLEPPAYWFEAKSLSVHSLFVFIAFFLAAGQLLVRNPEI
jgi:hypothetical protein